MERGTVMEIVLASSGGDGKHLVAQATDNLGRVGKRLKCYGLGFSVKKVSSNKWDI